MAKPDLDQGYETNRETTLICEIRDVCNQYIDGLITAGHCLRLVYQTVMKNRRFIGDLDI